MGWLHNVMMAKMIFDIIIWSRCQEVSKAIERVQNIRDTLIYENLPVSTIAPWNTILRKYKEFTDEDGVVLKSKVKYEWMVFLSHLQEELCQYYKYDQGAPGGEGSVGENDHPNQPRPPASGDHFFEHHEKAHKSKLRVVSLSLATHLDKFQEVFKSPRIEQEIVNTEIVRAYRWTLLHLAILTAPRDVVEYLLTLASRETLIEGRLFSCALSRQDVDILDCLMKFEKDDKSLLEYILDFKPEDVHEALFTLQKKIKKEEGGNVYDPLSIFRDQKIPPPPPSEKLKTYRQLVHVLLKNAITWPAFLHFELENPCSSVWGVFQAFVKDKVAIKGGTPQDLEFIMEFSRNNVF